MSGDSDKPDLRVASLHAQREKSDRQAKAQALFELTVRAATLQSELSTLPDAINKAAPYLSTKEFLLVNAAFSRLSGGYVDLSAAVNQINTAVSRET